MNFPEANSSYLQKKISNTLFLVASFLLHHTLFMYGELIFGSQFSCEHLPSVALRGFDNPTECQVPASRGVLHHQPFFFAKVTKHQRLGFIL